jgi:Transcriptional regulatory protein, C terminal
VVSAEELLEHVWDKNVDPLTSTVRTTIARLRRKLGAAAHDGQLALDALRDGGLSGTLTLPSSVEQSRHAATAQRPATHGRR